MSGYDLSLRPDSRFLTFRQNFTTGQHLMELYDAVKANAAIGASSPDTALEATSWGAESMADLSYALDDLAHAVDKELTGLGRGIAEQTWVIEAGFSLVEDHLLGLRRCLEDGFEGAAEVFSWGIARLCWEHEQDRAMYNEILETLQNPLTTAANELRKRGEHAAANGWWEEVVTDLRAALEKNGYDHLTHLQLGQVMWFRFGQWQPAMEQFELAAKYADVDHYRPEVTQEQKDAMVYYAALAYAHVSMLWRMDGHTAFPHHKMQSYTKAEQAARRAVELRGDLSIVIQERIASLLGLDHKEEALEVVQTAVEQDERHLATLEANPDIRKWPGFRLFAAQWRGQFDEEVLILLSLGREEEALEVVQTAAEENEGWLLTLEEHPDIRDWPEFRRFAYDRQALLDSFLSLFCQTGRNLLEWVATQEAARLEEYKYAQYMLEWDAWALVNYGWHDYEAEVAQARSVIYWDVQRASRMHKVYQVAQGVREELTAAQAAGGPVTRRMLYDAYIRFRTPLSGEECANIDAWYRDVDECFSSFR